MSDMTHDISTHYLGLKIRTPIIVGACPLTLRPEQVREFSIAGAGAVVLPSLFEEQVVHERLARGDRASGAERFVESVRYEEVEDKYNGGVEDYLDAVAGLKRCAGIPIIASLNGYTRGEWLCIATELEAAGADGLEVMLESDHMDAAENATQTEDHMLDLVSELCDRVSIPVAVKVSFFHSNLANLAWRLAESGASGMVCFAHDPGWKILKDKISATSQWNSLVTSNPGATISGLIRVRGGGPDISLAASGGIHSPENAVMAFLAGADVVMVTSEIYRLGPDAVAHLVEGLCSYLERNSVDTFQALVHARPQPKLRAHNAYLPFLAEDSQQGIQARSGIAKSGDRWGHVQR
jgi:dihydroorotate dehydrogenase (fumarate)